jgi:hypothetical protein
MSTQFSVPTGTQPAYDGYVDAEVFELLAPDTPNPTNHIRTTQNWGVRVKWETYGTMVPFLVDEFRLRAYVEGIGPLPEFISPPVTVSTMAGALVGSKRTYSLVVLIQLFDDAPGTNPYPIVAAVDLPLVTLFTPA